VTAFTAAGFLLLALQPVGASFPPALRARRGPIESRDEFLLAQPRLTLPALSPDVLPRGRTLLRVHGDWGNDFGLGAGGVPAPSFMVDGEHRSLAVEVSRGLSERITAGVRLPFLWRGGGTMDALIDFWHDLTNLPDGGRPRFPRDRLRVLGRTPEGRPLVWSGRAGSGLGSLELWARAAVQRPGHAGRWTAALAGRVALPTATAPFSDGGAHAAGQLVSACALGGAVDLYAGAGATVASRRTQQGVEYARLRPHGFVALEWRPGSAVSLLAELGGAGRLVRNLDGFPGFHLTLKMGAKVDVGSWTLEGGFSQGLKHISNTTDFGIMLGMARRL
jgi:hypothetical protein